MVATEIHLVRELGTYVLYVEGSDGWTRSFDANRISDFREGMEDSDGVTSLTRLDFEAAKSLFGKDLPARLSITRE